MTDKRYDATPKGPTSRVRKHTRMTSSGPAIVREHTRNLVRKGWGFPITAKKKHIVTVDDRADQVAYQTELYNAGKVPEEYLENINYSVKNVSDDVAMVTIGFKELYGPQRSHDELGFALGMLDIQVHDVFGSDNVILDDFYFSLHRAHLTYVVRKPGVSKKEWRYYQSYKQPEYRMANKPESLDIFKVREQAENVYSSKPKDKRWPHNAR
jgi:hypothetical protein